MEIGALDSLHDGRFTPCVLLWQIAALHQASFTRSAGKGQLPMDMYVVSRAERSGLPEMTGPEVPEHSWSPLPPLAPLPYAMPLDRRDHPSSRLTQCLAEPRPTSHIDRPNDAHRRTGGRRPR